MGHIVIIGHGSKYGKIGVAAECIDAGMAVEQFEKISHNRGISLSFVAILAGRYLPKNILYQDAAKA